MLLNKRIVRTQAYHSKKVKKNLQPLYVYTTSRKITKRKICSGQMKFYKNVQKRSISFVSKNSKYNPNYSTETFVPKTTDAIFELDQIC
jgi:hypothetical protein